MESKEVTSVQADKSNVHSESINKLKRGLAPEDLAAGDGQEPVSKKTKA